MADKKVKELKKEESSPLMNSTSSSNNIRIYVYYGACHKNQAVAVGGYALDGCGEFMARDEEGTEGAMICDACGCNRDDHMMYVQSPDV